MQQFGPGEFLFFENDVATDAHFLLSGQLKIVRETEDGQEVILRLIRAGEMFGGAGGWGAATYPATAVALDQARVFRLPVQEFARLAGHYPQFALAVIEELGLRLREAESRIRELQVERVERRIARTLLRLANKIGHKTDRGIQIDLPQSRQHLAELSGATLSTVSRVLSEWDRQGLILAGRERVTIVRPHELVVIAEDTVESDLG
ncbi:MAG: Crp/Fnr family transcriptional regulator [Thermomicrobiales bacterium]|nr:Crp/Fnr family transcriptional regulator [Thermomicrobiales bacterium]